MYANVYIADSSFINNDADALSKNIFMGFANVNITGSLFTDNR